MRSAGESKRDVEKVVDIISDAGGEIVGRTRLQKIGFLLEAAGLGDGFSFEYRHYGPYSEELANSARSACLMDMLEEQEKQASWGGFYSVYRSVKDSDISSNSARHRLIQLANNVDSVALELAATAVFLAQEGVPDPWGETAARKPEKAQDKYMQAAKALYADLVKIETPQRLPKLQ